MSACILESMILMETSLKSSYGMEVRLDAFVTDVCEGDGEGCEVMLGPGASSSSVVASDLFLLLLRLDPSGVEVY